MLSPALVEALSIAALPAVQWKSQDDLCDCTFQRIGMWTNPYLAETLEVRLCCIWTELYKQYPQFARTVPAFWDYNAEEWVTEPQNWDGEDDMPAAIWHRQIARKEGVSIPEARATAPVPPQGRPRREKPHVFLPFGGEYMEVLLG